jgi:hypothetical protein
MNVTLTSQHQAALASAIAKQLNVHTIDILQSLGAEGWSIFYVDTHQSDETYVFYAHDPLQSHYITLWSGAARIDEQQAMKAWVTQNAPGIPPKLAACFAWSVTEGRGKGISP